MKSLLPATLLLTAVLPASGGDAKSPVATTNGGDWQFFLSAGPAVRRAGTLGFSGGSRSAGSAIPSFVGQNSLTVPPIGGVDAIGDRIYNDGYVLRDPSTGIDGFTTNWGYQSSGQVSGDDIAFHATGFHSVRTDLLDAVAASSGDSREEGIAPVINFDGKYRGDWWGFRRGFSASLSWMPVRMDRSWSDFSLAQSRADFRDDYTDTYNLGGFGALVPGAPYAGTAAGPGFVLENIPDSRDLDFVQIGGDDALLTNRVRARIRADHTTLSFGPTLERELAKNWNLQLAGGVSLHWFHWSAEQREKLTVSKGAATSEVGKWHSASSGDEILTGLYLQIGSEWHPDGQPWSVKSFLRGDLGGSFSHKVGPSRFTYDPDGYTAAVLVSHEL